VRPRRNAAFSFPLLVRRRRVVPRNETPGLLTPGRDGMADPPCQGGSGPLPESRGCSIPSLPFGIFPDDKESPSETSFPKVSGECGFVRMLKGVRSS
jgi:hypothetical protein